MAEHSPAAERHARIRRLKRWLRYVPRRAVFHRYPLVGRFATAARKRAYLWSFRPEQVRPAIYMGCILALWPVMGVQFPLAIVLSMVLRANLMVAGGLQLITNPVTAAPVYYATYRIGKTVLQLVGWEAVTPPEPSVDSAATTDESITIDLSPLQPLPPELHWTASFGATLMALIVGGTICGVMLGVVLDILYRLASAFRQRRHP